MTKLLSEVPTDVHSTEALFYQYDWTDQKIEVREWNGLSCHSKKLASLTFEAFASKWLMTMRKNVHPRTYQNYQSKLMNHLLPTLGHYPLVEFEESLLDSWWNQLTPVLSETSAYGVYRVLHACLESAVEAHYLTFNPLHKLAVPKLNRKPIIFFSETEQASLLQAANQERRLPIAFALGTGVQIGELVQLTWDMVDWHQQTITIPCGLDRRSERRCAEAEQGRTIPLVPWLFAPLEKEYQESKSCYLFANRNGGPMEQRTLRNHFQKVKNRAQVADLPFQALRHSFAIRCIEAGLPLPTLSTYLNHASAQITVTTYQKWYEMSNETSVSLAEIWT